MGGVIRLRVLRPPEKATSFGAGSAVAIASSASDSSFTIGVPRFVRLLTRDPASLVLDCGSSGTGDGSTDALVRRSKAEGMRVPLVIDPVTVAALGETGPV